MEKEKLTLNQAFNVSITGDQPTSGERAWKEDADPPSSPLPESPDFHAFVFCLKQMTHIISGR
jgi:hypothetical protein